VIESRVAQQAQAPAQTQPTTPPAAIFKSAASIQENAAVVLLRKRHAGTEVYAMLRTLAYLVSLPGRPWTWEQAMVAYEMDRPSVEQLRAFLTDLLQPSTLQGFETMLHAVEAVLEPGRLERAIDADLQAGRELRRDTRGWIIPASTSATTAAAAAAIGATAAATVASSSSIAP
jgi:hypothetical protein